MNMQTIVTVDPTSDPAVMFNDRDGTVAVYVDQHHNDDAVLRFTDWVTYQQWVLQLNEALFSLRGRVEREDEARYDLMNGIGQ